MSTNVRSMCYLNRLVQKPFLAKTHIRSYIGNDVGYGIHSFLWPYFVYVSDTKYWPYMGLRVGLSEGLGILEMVIEHDLHVMFFEAKWAKAPPGSVVVSPTKGDA